MTWFIVGLLVMIAAAFAAGWVLSARHLLSQRLVVEADASAVAVDRAGLEAREAIMMHAGDAFLAIRRGTDLRP